MESTTTIEIEQPSREIKGQEKAPLLGVSNEKSARATGFKRVVAISDLILRLSAAGAGLAATITMGNTQQTLPFFTQFFQFQANYDDFPSFTFFVIAMSIAAGYLVLSVPFSIFCIAQPLAPGPRILLIFCDTLTVVLVTSAAAASAAIVYLEHNGYADANWLPICQQFDDFCRRTSSGVVGSFIMSALLIFTVALSALGLHQQ